MISADVHVLEYWKKEHVRETCEDAWAFSISDGLFVAADGTGSTIYADRWSHLLVEHYLQMPLLVDPSGGPDTTLADAFEVEWWLRDAQARFAKEITPELASAPLSSRRKAKEGTASTIVAARFVSVTRDNATAHLSALGDSCIMIAPADGTEEPWSWPLSQPPQFDYPPVCFTTRVAEFNHEFHRPKTALVVVKPGDTLLLVTDALARWILSGGDGRYASVRQAFFAVAEQTGGEFPLFIEECRETWGLKDDDVTAMVATFSRDGMIPLGTTTALPDDIIRIRRAAYAQALAASDSERIALAYGNGTWLDDVPPADIARVRETSRAFQRLRWIATGIVQPDKPDTQIRAEMLAQIAPLWRRYESLLRDDPCAASLRETIEHYIGDAHHPVSKGETVPGPIRDDDTPVSVSEEIIGHEPNDDATRAIAAIAEQIRETLHLNRLRPVAALKNTVEIAAIGSAVTPYEKERIIAAAILVEAIDTGGDKVLVDHLTTSEKAGNTFLYEDADARRFEDARHHLNEANGYLQGLASKDLRDIARAYEEHADFIVDTKLVTDEERERGSKANRLVTALRAGDADEVRAVWAEIVADRDGEWIDLSLSGDASGVAWLCADAESRQGMETIFRHADRALWDETAQMDSEIWDEYAVRCRTIGAAWRYREAREARDPDRAIVCADDVEGTIYQSLITNDDVRWMDRRKRTKALLPVRHFEKFENDEDIYEAHSKGELVFAADPVTEREERAAVERASRRHRAFLSLREIFAGEAFRPQDIEIAYNEIGPIHYDQHLPADERELYHLATEFLRACGTNNRQLIRAKHQALVNSKHGKKVIFTDEEQDAINDANKRTFGIFGST